jgi:DNA-binding NarL/FixJ family response regulator
VARVLIGDFGAIARLGLREFLSEQGFDIVAEEGEEEQVMDLVTMVRPDVVVLDLDADDGLMTAARITSDFPAVKVIACSSEEPRMIVFPPFHNGEWYRAQLSPQVLAEIVGS